MNEIANEHPDDEAFLIRVHPKVAALLNHPDSGLAELESECAKQFHFEGGEALSIDNFELIESGEKVKIQERSLPFRPEEEVFVKIEEPHMYNADDAIARIDSYIISVTGAASVVGERKLVRIESVERASAVASLLPEAEQPEDTSKKTETPKAERPRRNRNSGGSGSGARNGRSGGRTPAKAEEVSTDDAKSDPGGVAKAGPGPAGTGTPDPASPAESPAESGAKDGQDDKSVNSGRFGLRRGRRRRGRKSKTDADS
jgi:ribonuclease G